MRRIRTVLVVSLGAVTTLASAILLPGVRSAEALVAASPVSAGSMSACKPAPMVSDVVTEIPEAVTYRGPKFRVRVVTYRDSQGDVTEERIPTGTWSPGTATAAERNFLGVPTEPPKTSAAHRAWANAWTKHFTGMKLAPPCEPMKSISATMDSENWSGMISRQNSVTEAYGTTTYNAGTPCSVQPDSFTQWVGIGGYAGSPLLQNGFWADHASGHFAFWEALNRTNDTHVVPIYPWTFDANLGDRVSLATVWDGTYVHFGFHDLTDGALYELNLPTILNQPAANFYDGSSGEAIDERGLIGSQLSTLRNYGTDSWANVQIEQNHGAPVPIRATVHDGIIMNYNGTTYSSPGAANPDTPSSFADTWKTCGVLTPVS